MSTSTNPERHGILLTPQPILYPIDALPLARQAVLVAERELLRGVRENPPGSNRGTDVEIYQVGLYADGAGYLVGERWCARFVRYCYEKAAQEISEPRPFIGWREPGKSHDSDLASASKVAECARARGSIVVRTNLRFGDIGLFLNPNHVTLIVGRRGEHVITIEGNFRNQVAMVLRESNEFAAIVRVS